MTIHLGLLMIFSTGCGEKEDTSVPQTYTPTFTELENDILVCHVPFLRVMAVGQADFLNGEDDFERLVNVESTVIEGRVLVVPGDSSASYLIKKMRGSDDIYGDVMPPGGLDEEIVQSVN